MFTVILAIIAVGAVAYAVFLWSQGNPRVESFRDDCDNWAELFGRYGLVEVKRFFERWPKYREAETLGAMRERFKDFNDPEWFASNIAQPLLRSEVPKIVADPTRRSQLEQLLRANGYELKPLPDAPPETKS